VKLTKNKRKANEQILLASTRCNTLFFSKTADDFGWGWFLHRIFWYTHGVVLIENTRKLLGYFTVLLFVAPSVIGWVLNIFKIIEAETITGFILVRCVGVLMAPLGAIFGWF